MSEERGHDLTPRDLTPRDRHRGGSILLAVVLGVALGGSAAAELGRLDAAERGQVLYRTIMFGPSPLTRLERELVATVVSEANGCHY